MTIIKLKDDASPYALHAPRNMPIALRAKVREELNRMEKMGIIPSGVQAWWWCPKSLEPYKFVWT